MESDKLTERLATLSPAKRALLELKLQQGRGRTAAQMTIPRRAQRGSAPLSFAQQRLWFLDQLEPESFAYNERSAVRLDGPLDIGALRSALSAIVERHEVLRTTYGLTDSGEPVQQIGAAVGIDLPVIDISEVAESQRDDAVQRIAAELRERSFDLRNDMPLRLALVRLGANSHVLVEVKHHIASDGWSSGIFSRELAAIYSALSQGRPNPLAELPVQYADYSLWQREWLQGEVLEKQLAYWKEQLKDIPVLELPMDRRRGGSVNRAGAKQSVTLSKSLADRLKALSRQEGATLFMTLLTAFHVLLHRYTGQDDIAVGSPIAGRTRSETEGLIGFFVNTLVLRSKLSGNPTFKELLAQVRETALQAYEHQDVPFEKLVEDLKPERDQNHTPFVQVMFALQNVPRASLEMAGLQATPVEVASSGAKFDIFAAFIEREGEMMLRVEYSTELFAAAWIERMLGHFQALLDGIVAKPEQSIGTYPILAEAEQQRLLIDWNDTQRDYSDGRCVHELFEARVNQSPEAVALVFENESWSYRELNCRANQLARYLRGLGVGRDTLVALCVDRSMEMVVALLAILKAGGAYVPMDPEYPKDRLEFMLRDTQAPVLVTQKRISQILPEYPGQSVCLDGDRERIARESEENFAHEATADSLAYVIYTSGSTGTPKGVMIQHGSVCNFLASMAAEPGMSNKDTLLAVTTLSFDIAGLEIYLPLSVGARIVLVSRDVAVDGFRLAAQLSDCGATMMQATPVTWRMLLASGWQGSRELKILCGGEALSEDLASQLAPRCASLWNMYGPTETTIWSSIQRIPENIGKISLGRPIANTQYYILDGHLNPVPVGVAGELHIGGEGLARGYLNRPELVSEKFISNPFSKYPMVRLYKTGDRVRYLPGGEIEFLGRIDDQVKIRGYRIELGEIEAMLGQHVGIQQAVVLALEDTPGDRRLVAYAVASPGMSVSASELRSYLQLKLPEYMIPSAFMFLESLPLTPNGKVDRKVLPAPDQNRPELDESFAVPRTPVEEILASLWAGILKLDKVGIHDNFFHLGGHSLLATQVISRINDSLATSIQLRRLFETPTIAGIAASIDTSLGAKIDPQRIPPIVPIARNHDAPLSFAQQRLWFLDRLDPDSAAYNVPAAFRLVGELDARALEQSLNEIVRRHEILRTVVVTVNGDPVQKVLPPSPLAMTRTDISDHPENDREQVLPSFLSEEAEKPFDLSRGPLLRIKLLRLAPQDHILLLNMHHIVSDGWSMGVLFREISALYDAYCSGKASPLPELPVQYADYSVWQKQWLQGEELDQQLSYWRKQLDGLSTLQLPTDRARPAVQTYRGSRLTLNLSAPLSEAIKSLSQREGVTLFMTLLAAFQLLLSRYSGQSDIAVGSPIAGRNRQETEGLIGFFVNTLVLRTDLSKNPTFRELLRQVRETTLEAYSHQDLPFEKLVEELHPDRNLSISPLFQVMFVFQNTADQPLELEQIVVSSVGRNSSVAKFDLSLTMSEKDGKLRGYINYNTDIFDASTIERMIGHFQTLLEGIVVNPNEPISALPLLTEAEKHRLLVAWNDTNQDYPSAKCIHQLFEAQVEQTPEAVAVVYAEQQLTYRELNCRANQLAHYLRNHGVGSDVLVGICVERSIDMVVGLLGILKAGGAYVPLDPTYPKERLGFMLEDTQAGIIVTDSDSLGSLPSSSARVICLDRDWQAIAKELQVNPDNQTTADNLAYVIYTSGSTGVPKGAEILHRGVVRLLFGVDYVRLDGTQTILHSAPISFDAATFEVWGALLHGGQCVLYPGKVPSPRELGDVLKKHRVDTLWLTAALFNMVIDEEPETLSEVKYLLIGGEALSAPHVRRGLALLAKTQIVNGYGPTESTTFTCCYPIARQLDDNLSSISIGKPIANTQVYILDGYLNPVPIGVPGELHIGGDGLARGYLNRPELTAEKFIGNPFSSEARSRLYKTGDLARYLPDGSIEFLGRIDDQVKIRGYRIELGEIEAVLGQHPAVQSSAVVVQEDVRGDKRLVGYVVARQKGAFDAADVRTHLKHKLPEYMIPSAMVLLDELPLNPNGKVDRRALPAPDQSRSEPEESYVAPRTATEEVLAGMWAEVLKVDKVGVRDNFFDLGGHSLLAVRLTNTIQKQFKTAIRVAHVFAAPTVEQFALLLQGPRESSWSSLVVLNSQGSRRPFFWVHGEASDAYLPRYLGQDQPLYGLRHQSEDGQPALYRTVEEIAAHYLEEIRSVQPQGPYLLGGYCFGALVALEMAQRLQAHRQRIDLLVLVNPSISQIPERHYTPRSIPLRLSNLRRHRHAIAQLRPQAKWSYVMERARVFVRETVRNACDPVKKIIQRIVWETCIRIGVSIPVSLRSPYILEIYQNARRSYTPRRFAGNTILFLTNSRPQDIRLKLFGQGGTEAIIHDAPGDHHTVLEEPNVGVWAKELKAYLDRARHEMIKTRESREGTNPVGETRATHAQQVTGTFQRETPRIHGALRDCPPDLKKGLDRL